MPSGTLGYNKAEVTLGGVDTAGCTRGRWRHRTLPELFFIGEAVDVRGGWAGTIFSGRGRRASPPRQFA